MTPPVPPRKDEVRRMKDEEEQPLLHPSSFLVPPSKEPLPEFYPRQPIRPHRLLQRLRWQLSRNAWRVILGQSSVRPFTILLCSLLVWAFVFGVSYEGFRFLRDVTKLDMSGEIVGILLSLLFLSLGVLLVFSCCLILYGSLFTSPEARFLLGTPLGADKVFAYKFQGALGFSSWAFLLLGAPVLIAYGLVCHAPWHFFVLLPLFFLGFILLPGAIGGLACLLIVNFVPRRRKQVLAVAGLLLVALVAWWIYQVIQDSRAAVRAMGANEEALVTLLGRFSFTRHPLMPSRWVEMGLRRASRGDLSRSLWYLALLWSWGLFGYLVTAFVSAHLYRRGLNRIATGGSIRRVHGRGIATLLDRLLQVGLFFIDARTRLLIVKDFRTFRRDPQQWGQILLFTGLMALYFTNVRRLFIQDIQWVYQNTISLLNLCAIALLLCTYTGRFVFPLLSLEGRKFWILGLLPLHRDQLLWGKFVFAAAGGLLITVPLILLSDLMLWMPWDVVVLHVLTVVVLSAGLSGLSVGLGAAMPNFRETDPSKIAAGFGGTLNLIAGLLFLLVTLCVLAVPWHLQKAFLGEANKPLPQGGLLVIVGAVTGLFVGAAAVVFPLRLGIRSLRKMEF
jgi:ABC-2 type transport system permease protein